MEFTLDQALQKGIAAHKAGKVQEADRYYTAILKANPKHPDANHNMGVLAVSFGKVEQALPFLKSALEANSNIDQYWLSYIGALIKLDRLADAKEIFNQAKSKGAKGDGFDQIELELKTSLVEFKNKAKEEIPNQINILDELKLDKAFKLAKNKVKDGLINEAKMIYQDILKRFPKNKKALGGIKKLASQTLVQNSDIQEAAKEQLNSLINLYNQQKLHQVFSEAQILTKQYKKSVTLWSLLGASAAQIGKLDEAVLAFKQALLIKPDDAQAHYNMGNVLKDQEKFEEALGSYRKALSLKPDYSEAYLNMGNVLKDQGSLEGAFAAYKKALSIKPDYSEAYFNMGNALKDQEKYEEAIAAYNKAINLKPDYSEAYLNIGNVLKDQGKLKEAIKVYNEVLSIKPDYAEVYFNMGNAFKDQGRLEEAIKTYNKAIYTKPDYAEAYNNLGNAFNDRGKSEEAVQACKKALSLNPDYAEAYFNMGNALHNQGKLEEAIETYQKALYIKPDYAKAHLNMGNVLNDQNKSERAIEAFNKALLIQPDYADAYNNMSFVKLKLELIDGIKLREWRWKTKGSQPYVRKFKAPKWDGSFPLQDKTLLVWGEQGPGDIIIWCSCLEYLTSICANIIVECLPKLVKILSLSFPKINFRPERKNLNCATEDFDFQVPMETLFGYACLSGKIADDQASYIIPSTERVEYWVKKLRENTKKKCVGISWKSPVMTTKRLNNYADLSFWKPLLQNKNYKFFNLQSSDFEDDLERISRDFGVNVTNFDEIDHYNDLAEVAAFCKALDKTVSIATAVSTISAAVGTHTLIPTWKQSPWNNLLFNSRGPKVDLYYRNTWETWDNAFNNILESLK